MSIKRKAVSLVGSLLHQEAFFAESPLRQGLKQGLIDERLRASFAENGYALGTRIRVETTNPRRWRLIDGQKAWLIKDPGDQLVVIRETMPAVCRLIESLAFRVKPRYYNLRWRTKQMASQCGWTIRKRWRDKPGRLLVNVGAGNWYAPGWKILEYRGPWYNFYAPGFIDYGHDLTSSDPFPFADGSVHLFYCEHVVEHLKDEWCAHLFREVFRGLESGGGFRVVMPDADLIYRSLVKRDGEFFKSWMERDNSSLEEAFCTLVAQSRRLDKGEIDRRLATMSKHEFLDLCKEGLEYDWKRAGEHINWFDFEKLSEMLEAAGFREVRRNEGQQSRFEEARGPKFDTRPRYSLHVDCVKP